MGQMTQAFPLQVPPIAPVSSQASWVSAALQPPHCRGWKRLVLPGGLSPARPGHGAGPLGYSLPLRASPLHLIWGVCHLQQLSRKLLHFSGPELTAWWLPLLVWGCVCATVVCRAAVPRGPLGRNGDSGAQLLSPSALGGLAPQLEPTLQQRGLLASGSACCPAALTQWLLCLCTPSPGARVTLRSLALWPLHVGSVGLGLRFRSPASLSALAGH